MKKLFLLLLILAPLTLTAAPVNYLGKWSTYSQPTATMHVKCGLPGGTKTEVGNALASTGQVSFQLDANPGDDKACVFYATLGPDTSPDSSEVAVHVPLALPVPTGLQVVPL